MSIIDDLDDIEAQVIQDGPRGATKAINTLKKIAKKMSPAGRLTIRNNWIGGQEVVCGIDPSDGNFFVGTQTALSNKPVVAKNSSDVQRLFSGVDAKGLSVALRYLKNVVTKDVMAGNILFTNNKSTSIVDGESMITFAPSSVRYVAPIDSEIGKEINGSAMGVVFRSKFVGSSLSSMNKVDFDETDTNDTSSVFIAKDGFVNASGLIKFTPDEYNGLMSAILAAERNERRSSGVTTKIKRQVKTIDLADEFQDFMSDYFKRRATPNVNGVFSEFLSSMQRKYKVNSSRARNADDEFKTSYKYMEAIDYIARNEANFKAMILVYINIRKAKDVITNKIKGIMQSGSFNVTPTGVEANNDMGFVAVSINEGIKLVSDLDFEV